MTEIACVWDGDHFVPLQREAKRCDEVFVVGRRYVVEVMDLQSAAKRAMFHATLNDIYASLPDDLAQRWLNVEAFRKWLTIRAGYAEERQIIYATKTDAERSVLLAQALAPYAIVERRDCVVTVWTAKSTAARAMDGRTFSKLVDDVLAKAAEVTGIDPRDMRDYRRQRRDRPDKQVGEG